MAGSGSRWLEKVDLRWQTLSDAGSPIDTAHYRVIDRAGQALGPTRALGGEGVQGIEGLATPERRGEYAVQVWLSDAEGNVGSAATVPLPRDTVPPAAPQEVSVTAPGASRAAEGFDVRWRNIGDDGSPIEAAHYQVLNAGGNVLVPATTLAGLHIEAIPELVSPRERGGAVLRLWLSDAEGNTGAPVHVPLSYACVRSEAGAAATLTSAAAPGRRPQAILEQGEGTALRGRLTGASGGVADAAICVFSRVVTESARQFVGISLTGEDGSYRYAVPAGPSRELTVAYRGGHRELAGSAQVETRVKPTFAARRKVVRNKGVARFTARIPGPSNDDVVMVFQVKRGDGWLAFRRCRTRDGGRCSVGYRFTRTDRPTDPLPDALPGALPGRLSLPAGDLGAVAADRPARAALRAFGSVASRRRETVVGASNGLSIEAAHHYARIYSAARAGCMAELRRAGCDEAEAEDIFAATLERIMRKLDPVGEGYGQAQTVALLKQACRQKLIDERRHRDVLRIVPLKEAISRSDPTSQSAAEAAEAREAVAIGREAISSLPERDRRVFLQRHHLDLSPEEIVRRNPGLSPRTYRKLIQRANARALAAFEEIDSGARCAEMRARAAARLPHRGVERGRAGCGRDPSSPLPRLPGRGDADARWAPRDRLRGGRRARRGGVGCDDDPAGN